MNSIDIETFGREFLRAYCFCFIYNKKIYVHYGLNCVEASIFKMFNLSKTSSVYYSHNLTFDGGLILSNLPSNVEIDSKNTSIRRGSIYSLCLKKGNSFIILKCSAKILPLPLEEVSKLLSLPEKQVINHDEINANNFSSPDIALKVIKYCRRDTEIVSMFVNLLNSSIFVYMPDWIFFCQSISGIAVRLFKKNFNIHKIFNIDLKIDEMLRPSYYGGRCEVFGNAKSFEFVHHYDFPSMYTNLLLKKYPIGVGKVVTNCSSITKLGFYSVKIFSSNLEIPILPYRDPNSQKLLFPEGNFDGLYWGEELNLFLENGGIIEKIYWGYEYTEESFVFKNFAEFCLENRKKEKIDNVLWKLIPNSLIGRLGLKVENEETIIKDLADYDPRDYELIYDRIINTKVIVRHKKLPLSLKNSGNVAYAAITTSRARILWWKAANDLKFFGGRLLYCDTDSIFAAFPRKIIGERHNYIYWDDSKKNCLIKKSCFASSKAYAIIFDNSNTVLKIKGVDMKKNKEITYEDFENNFYKNKSADFKTTNFIKNTLNISIKDVLKRINFYGYEKRIFSEDKKNTLPLKI